MLSTACMGHIAAHMSKPMPSSGAVNIVLPMKRMTLPVLLYPEAPIMVGEDPDPNHGGIKSEQESEQLRHKVVIAVKDPTSVQSHPEAL